MPETEKYQYEFSNGDVFPLRISKEWASLLRELDRQEANNDQRETRRHCSLERYNQYDNRFPLAHEPYEQLEEQDVWIELCRLLTRQEMFIGDLYFRKGFLQQDIAARFSLTQSRVAQVVQEMRAKLNSFFVQRLIFLPFP